MKLLTTIKPRTDGTVIYHEPASTSTGPQGGILRKPALRIVFAPNDEGTLVADVPDDDLVTKLLMLGTFEPADETDFEKADAMVGAAKAKERLKQRARRARAAQAADGAGDDDDLDEADETMPGQLPVEARTPPKPAKGKPAVVRA